MLSRAQEIQQVVQSFGAFLKLISLQIVDRRWSPNVTEFKLFFWGEVELQNSQSIRAILEVEFVQFGC